LVIRLLGTCWFVCRTRARQYEAVGLQLFRNFADEFPVNEKQTLSSSCIVAEHDVMPLRVRSDIRSDDRTIRRLVNPFFTLDTNRFGERLTGSQTDRFETAVSAWTDFNFAFRI